MCSRTICFANQKGGVAKTTTCINTASALTKRGYSVLVVDMDPQANATRGMGYDPDSFEDSIYDLFKSHASGRPADVRSMVLDSSQGRILRSSSDLAVAETEFIGRPGREFMLREVLEGVSSEYDFVLIDTAPNLGWGVLNALTASDSVVIPCAPQLWANEGMMKLKSTIDMIRAYSNPALAVAGILITNAETRTIAASRNLEVSEAIGDSEGMHIFSSIIPHATVVNDSATDSIDMLAVYPLSKPSIAYEAFANELIEEAA